MSERIERWGIFDKQSDALITTVSNSIAESERSSLCKRRVYIIDADAEDAKRCENCKHYREPDYRGIRSCVEMEENGFASTHDNFGDVASAAFEPCVNFHCKFFERK